MDLRHYNLATRNLYGDDSVKLQRAWIFDELRKEKLKQD